MPCNIQHSSFHKLEATIRKEIAGHPSISARDLQAFLERSGYKMMAEPFLFPEYVRILGLLDNPGRMLNEKELRAYGVQLRNLLLEDPSMPADDLLRAFSAVYG